MFNFASFARQALLAATLALSSAAALAGPSYLVTIHTGNVDAEAGLMDFNFYTTNDAIGGTASLSNFSGAFGAEYDRAGSADGSVADTLTFTPGLTSNYLTQNVLFGGDFSFNVTFSGDYETVAGLYAPTFQVSLYDAFLATEYGVAVQFDLLPALNADAAGVLVTINDPLLASVTELVASDVPEPSAMLMMLSTLALAGVALRRRRSR
ncbi:NF038129 family PEP-CTERM protein [Massilia sp. TSP1-1-2]|uniref:NF038129 family PEP-CTERM protein n=1 Tax=unclassified Massilia TaxID=2609279 RepID=UPI003CF65017